MGSRKSLREASHSTSQHSLAPSGLEGSLPHHHAGAPARQSAAVIMCAAASHSPCCSSRCRQPSCRSAGGTKRMDVWECAGRDRWTCSRQVGGECTFVQVNGWTWVARQALGW